MKDFLHIKADYRDDNGVLHIDGYKGEMQEGVTIGYVFNGQVYYTNPEYRYSPDVKNFVENMLFEKPQPIYEPIGEYVNDGNEYELCGYVFKQSFDVGDFGDSIESLEVRDSNDCLLETLYINFPNENDLESVRTFEQTLITWLKGSKYI